MPRQILDTGDRTEFTTGAVRDMHEGKGRCDLLPLDVVASCLDDDQVLYYINVFQSNNDIENLKMALVNFFVNYTNWGSRYTMFLEVAKHFEEGAKKYGESNWKKGIPVKFYIDSAVRHFLKYIRGDQDEPHDRAFCWNIICAMWTCKHKPELNDYGKEDADVVSSV